MPIISDEEMKKLEAAHGGKSEVISDADMAKLEAAHAAPKEKSLADSALEAAEDFPYGAAQGATMGFSDELAGALGAAGTAITGQDPTGKYEEYRDLIRKLQSQAQERSPYAYGAGEVAGAAAIPMGASKIGGTALKAALQSPALLGAAMGAGTAEDLASTPEKALEGAALGKAGSFVGPKLGAAIGGGISAMELAKENPDYRKAVAAPLLGLGLGKANVAQGSAYSSGNKAIDEVLNPANSKILKNAKEIAMDPRKLFDENVLNAAVKSDVDNEAKEIIAKLNARDKAISQQFGIKLEQNADKAIDVTKESNTAEEALRNLKDLSPTLENDRDRLLARLGRYGDQSNLTPAQVKELELQFQAQGNKSIGRGLSRDFKETSNPVKDVLNEYNNSLNKKINSAVPEIADLNNSLRAERSYKERVLGLEPDMSDGEKIEQMSNYIRNNAESMGRGAQSFESQQAGALHDISKIPGSQDTNNAIEQLIAPSIASYSTANKVVGAGQVPELGLAGAMRQRARAAFAPKTISALGHVAKNINAKQAELTSFAGKMTPDIVQKAAAKGINISKQVNAIALEKDPVRKNAMIFAISQNPKHWEEVENLKNLSEETK